MAGGLIGALRVTLGIDTAAFEEGLSNARRQLNAAGQKMQAVGDGMANVGSKLSVAVTAPLLAAGAAAVKGAQDQAQAMAQVNAALESMGPVAGRTADQLLKASDALELNSLYDGDEILSKVTANMLTFGNVTGDTFDRAQQAVIDLSTRMNTDLQSATIMVGKALNDPKNGLAALGKTGALTKEWVKENQGLIASLVDSGRTAEAQAMILAALEKQYRGSAKAAADTSPWRKAQVALGQVGDAIGELLLPVIRQVSDFVARAAQAFAGLSPEAQTFIVVAGAIAAAVGPILVVLGTLVSSIGALIPVFAPVVALIGGAFGAGGVFAGAFSSLSAFTAMLSLLGGAVAPLLGPIAAVAAVGALIYANWDKIAPILSELRDKFVAAIGPKLISLIETVKTTISAMAATVSEKLTALWNGPLGMAIRVVMGVLGELAAAFLTYMGDNLIRLISALVSAIEAGFKIVGDVFNIVIGLLTGDFAMAWEGLKSLVGNVIEGVVNIFKSLYPEAAKVISDLATGFGKWFGDLATRMVTWGRNIIDGLVRGILAAPEAVWNALKSVVLRGVENIREFLGIASPSKLFMEMGGFVSEGMALGITGGLPKVEAAMDALGSTVADRLGAMTPGQGLTIDAAFDGEAVGTAAAEAGSQIRDTFRQTFADGIKAALDGDLGGFLERTFSGILDNAARNAASVLSDALTGLLGGLFGGTGQGGGGLGELLGGALRGLFGGSPGFALGGNFTVGGRPGRDANLVAFRATRGEHVTVSTSADAANPGGGMGPIQFNFYGPVSNPEQVRRSAAQAGAHLLRLAAAGQRGS